MEELEAIDEDRLRKINKKLNDHNIFPVRDGIILPEDLYEAYQGGKGAGIDMLIGTNADETRYWIGEMGSWFQILVRGPGFLSAGSYTAFRKEDRDLAKAFLTLQKGAGSAHRATEFFNELVFRVPSIVQASFHAENGGNTICTSGPKIRHPHTAPATPWNSPMSSAISERRSTRAKRRTKNSPTLSRICGHVLLCPGTPDRRNTRGSNMSLLPINPILPNEVTHGPLGG